MIVLLIDQGETVPPFTTVDRDADTGRRGRISAQWPGRHGGELALDPSGFPSS